MLHALLSGPRTGCASRTRLWVIKRKCFEFEMTVFASEAFHIYCNLDVCVCEAPGCRPRLQALLPEAYQGCLPDTPLICLPRLID